jgi:hypothetical protein
VGCGRLSDREGRDQGDDCREQGVDDTLHLKHLRCRLESLGTKQARVRAQTLHQAGTTRGTSRVGGELDGDDLRVRCAGEVGRGRLSNCEDRDQTNNRGNQCIHDTLQLRSTSTVRLGTLIQQPHKTHLCELARLRGEGARWRWEESSHATGATRGTRDIWRAHGGGRIPFHRCTVHSAFTRSSKCQGCDGENYCGHQHVNDPMQIRPPFAEHR